MGLRKPNTGAGGSGFDPRTVQAVWQKAQPVPGYNSTEFRKDTCGWWMLRSAYGSTDSEYGWEIDHIRPVALGGSDDLANLQPLHWKNNRSKGDSYPKWYCAVS
jgi:5-methylcytosine-specific restriction endonuclease McrA